MDYIIATASTCDLTREYLDEHNIPFVKYSYVIGDEQYSDDCREATRQTVYKQMREGAVLLTSAINTFTYYEFFEKLVKEGKNVIFLDMCRSLSSSYKFAEEAIAELKEEYPDQTVINVDTGCVSGGLGMLVELVTEQYEMGKSMEEVLDFIEAIKLKIAHRFTVDDLNYLKKGGRVSNASALVGTLLSIKPILYVPDSGTLEVAQKVRGRKIALNSILESIKNEVKDDGNVRFRIHHADCMDECLEFKSRLLEIYPNAKVEIAGLGVVIGAHCGPGLFTIFYMTDERRPK